MSTEAKLERWHHALSMSGESLAARDLKRLKITAIAAEKIESAMKRIQDGTARPKEFERVRGDIYKFSVSIDGRWYRIFYAHCGGGLVMLSSIAKKKNSLSNGEIETAENRLKEHRKLCRLVGNIGKNR